jgi:hypothetical protein
VAWWVTASPSAPAPTGPTSGPRRVTPLRPAHAQPKTVKDAIVMLQTTRPAKEAAELVAALLAAPDPPSALDRAALRTAALDRVAREGRDREGVVQAAVFRVACSDALHALAIALPEGPVDRSKHADLIDALVKLIDQLNETRAYELIDDDLLRLLADVVPRLRDVEVARASGDLCETADRAPLHADPDAIQAALEAAIAAGENSDLRFVRGKLLAHRTLREGRKDLIAAALEDLAFARDLRDPGASKNQALLARGIAARLHAVRGEHSAGLALLDLPLEPELAANLRSSSGARTLLALERARLELIAGRGQRAAEILIEAANAAKPMYPIDLVESLEQAAAKAVTLTQPAELEAVARSLPDIF